MQHYRERLMHSFCAAERGLVDDVIRPQETRKVLCEALAMLEHKASGPEPRRKHAVVLS